MYGFISSSSSCFASLPLPQCVALFCTLQPKVQGASGATKECTVSRRGGGAPPRSGKGRGGNCGMPASVTSLALVPWGASVGYGFSSSVSFSIRFFRLFRHHSLLFFFSRYRGTAHFAHTIFAPPPPPTGPQQHFGHSFSPYLGGTIMIERGIQTCKRKNLGCNDCMWFHRHGNQQIPPTHQHGLGWVAGSGR